MLELSPHLGLARNYYVIISLFVLDISYFIFVSPDWRYVTLGGRGEVVVFCLENIDKKKLKLYAELFIIFSTMGTGTFRGLQVFLLPPLQMFGDLPSSLPTAIYYLEWTWLYSLWEQIFLVLQKYIRKEGEGFNISISYLRAKFVYCLSKYELVSTTSMSVKPLWTFTLNIDPILTKERLKSIIFPGEMNYIKSRHCQ